MSHADFNRKFMDKFRQEYITYPSAEEQQYQHFLFRQFTGIGNEIAFLGNWLSQKTGDVEINRHLAGNLKKKDIPVSDHLLGFVQNFNEFLSSCAQKESFTANYYFLLLADLKPFFSLINSFRGKMQLNLLNKLDASSSGNVGDLFDQELDDLLTEMEEYSCQIRKYYDYFNFLLKEESAGSRGIALLSQVEEYLSELISHTEKLLMATEYTQSVLEKHQIKLTSLENQELYN